MGNLNSSSFLIIWGCLIWKSVVVCIGGQRSYETNMLWILLELWCLCHMSDAQSPKNFRNHFAVCQLLFGNLWNRILSKVFFFIPGEIFQICTLFVWEFSSLLTYLSSHNCFTFILSYLEPIDNPCIADPNPVTNHFFLPGFSHATLS